ncbi:hypothetical protein DIPPA_24898 [Diplonema papillatum]|nr:hypothetical protein DIPPA_24898 [Diplonema papillatum]
MRRKSRVESVRTDFNGRFAKTHQLVSRMSSESDVDTTVDQVKSLLLGAKLSFPTLKVRLQVFHRKARKVAGAFVQWKEKKRRLVGDLNQAWLDWEEARMIEAWDSVAHRHRPSAEVRGLVETEVHVTDPCCKHSSIGVFWTRKRRQYHEDYLQWRRSVEKVTRQLRDDFAAAIQRKQDATHLHNARCTVSSSTSSEVVPLNTSHVLRGRRLETVEKLSAAIASLLSNPPNLDVSPSPRNLMELSRIGRKLSTATLPGAAGDIASLSSFSLKRAKAEERRCSLPPGARLPAMGSSFSNRDGCEGSGTALDEKRRPLPSSRKPGRHACSELNDYEFPAGTGGGCDGATMSPDDRSRWQPFGSEANKKSKNLTIKVRIDLYSRRHACSELNDYEFPAGTGGGCDGATMSPDDRSRRQPFGSQASRRRATRLSVALDSCSAGSVDNSSMGTGSPPPSLPSNSPMTSPRALGPPFAPRKQSPTPGDLLRPSSFTRSRHKPAGDDSPTSAATQDDVCQPSDDSPMHRRDSPCGRSSSGRQHPGKGNPFTPAAADGGQSRFSIGGPEEPRSSRRHRRGKQSATSSTCGEADDAATRIPDAWKPRQASPEASPAASSASALPPPPLSAQQRDEALLSHVSLHASNPQPWSAVSSILQAYDKRTLLVASPHQGEAPTTRLTPLLSRRASMSSRPDCLPPKH